MVDRAKKLIGATKFGVDQWDTAVPLLTVNIRAKDHTYLGGFHFSGESGFLTMIPTLPPTTRLDTTYVTPFFDWVETLEWDFPCFRHGYVGQKATVKMDDVPEMFRDLLIGEQERHHLK